MSSILDRINRHKRKIVAERELKRPLSAVMQLAEQTKPARDFIASLKNKIAKKQPAIIAEIKKASPSKGVIRPEFDPVAIAKSYQQAGAACISVLTDEDFFQGCDQYLIDVRRAVSLPLLRKDFIVSTYQIYESRAIGADCILLIAASLDQQQLSDFNQLAQELGMATLIEVHNEAELDLALTINTPLIGINNRDLHTFKTSLQTTFQLAKKVPDEKIIISESGINTQEDIHALQHAGIPGFLIGESLMRATDPGVALLHLLRD